MVDLSIINPRFQELRALIEAQKISDSQKVRLQQMAHSVLADALFEQRHDALDDCEARVRRAIAGFVNDG
jgi:hypothetical protein